MLITIVDATIRYRDRLIFNGLSLTIRQNQNWAVVGPAGSGKSSLLRTLAGQYRVATGKIQYPFYERYREKHAVSDPFFSPQRLMALVTAGPDGADFSHIRRGYYQQRFNAADTDLAPTVKTYLRSQTARQETDGGWDLEKTITAFGLASLAGKRLLQISSGETRRLMVAAALLNNPRLLLLDHPLAGLDVATRAKFEDIFQQIATSGISLVMTCSPYEIPEVITHVATLDKERRLRNYERREYQAVNKPVPPKDLSSPEMTRSLPVRRGKSPFSVLVAMKNVRVAYGAAVIFDRINWVVRPGDCWSLTGPNGSGKTTLLSLINGDHPQAYANDIVLFDRPRGSGESIWEIKRRIGFVSPELHRYFPRHYTCLQAVESGLYDTLGLFVRSRPENRKRAEQWLDIMGLSSLRDSMLIEVSASSQRLCLLARAMVKNPYLLLLDEPCLGFDQRQQRTFRSLIDQLADGADLGIVYVTHQQETLPTCINHTLQLGSRAFP